MPRKSVRKTKKTPKRKTMRFSYSQIALFIPILLLLIIGLQKGISKTHVLGIATGPLIAEGGDSGSGSSGSGSDDSSGSGSNTGSLDTSGSGSGGSGGGSGGESQDTSGSTQPSGVTNPSGSITVDCVGPDGKHITVTFSQCAELNKAWHHTQFTFTPLTIKSGRDTRTATNEADLHQNEDQKPNTKELGKLMRFVSQKGKQNVTLGNDAKINIESAGGSLHVKAEDNGKDTELESGDALETLNGLLDDKNLEIGTTSANRLALKSGNVEAETHFPLSVDPTTGELSITTPAGSKVVTVLPDEAVQNLLSKHIVTDIESQAASGEAGFTSTQQANLTLLGTEPVFEINGVSNKHLLGIFPVGFAKTSFVSAQTGDVVKTNESGLNRFLELFSF